MSDNKSDLSVLGELTEDERMLLEKYRSLDTVGQKYFEGLSDGLWERSKDKEGDVRI